MNTATSRRDVLVIIFMVAILIISTVTTVIKYIAISICLMVSLLFFSSRLAYGEWADALFIPLIATLIFTVGIHLLDRWLDFQLNRSIQ